MTINKGSIEKVIHMHSVIKESMTDEEVKELIYKLMITTDGSIYHVGIKNYIGMMR